MNNELDIIDNLAELERFLLSVENGSLGLNGVEGIGLATNNSDGRHFIAVFDKNQKLLFSKWVTKEVFEQGKDIVRHGVKRKH
ncbi:hypothetical protein CJF42_01075 [Pseudoalteromonas sp. NBT06-2]|uniref:hypothetical protein n=1 Tax=Pseudoalteromonas sp. NBT06-2 TaxID=2025950 RepID=UPI000BA53B00|nr:hypothetical protein [Pseudoalteromonas sp. NBT06-2]PAJ76108.1 hypothetical protein CJF42_01075 [Pseudoalteromonas sp. NBT06-2]